MHESILRDFFLGRADAKELSRDIQGSRVVTSHPGAVPVVSRNHIVDMESEFEVSRANLIALCDGFLAGSLHASDLEFIGFALECSSKFTWDGDQDDMLASIISEWASPEINYRLDVDNIGRCRRWLQGTGEYPSRTNASI